MNVGQLLNELKARGCTLEKPVAAFEHQVVRNKGRVVVIPVSDLDATVGGLFLGKVAAQLGLAP